MHAGGHTSSNRYIESPHWVAQAADGGNDFPIA